MEQGSQPFGLRLSEWLGAGSEVRCANQPGSVYGGVCIYPECHCPFDAPDDPNWCAKGLPHMRAPNVAVERAAGGRPLEPLG